MKKCKKYTKCAKYEKIIKRVKNVQKIFKLLLVSVLKTDNSRNLSCFKDACFKDGKWIVDWILSSWNCHNLSSELEHVMSNVELGRLNRFNKICQTADIVFKITLALVIITVLALTIFWLVSKSELHSVATKFCLDPLLPLPQSTPTNFSDPAE